MNNRSSAVALAAALACVCTLGFSGYELHRGRVATEHAVDGLNDVVVQVSRVRESVEALKPASAPAICPKSASHLDHDVNLGTAHECADAPGVMCVSYEGKEMTAQVADARCKAGKL